MKTRFILRCAVAAMLAGFSIAAEAESMATINDPDGYTNVRGEENKIIARVKTGEKFLTWEPHYPSESWEVILPSGVRGSMHRSRIRLLPDEPLMKLSFPNAKKEWLQGGADGEEAEVDQQARGRGINYNKTLAQGADGDVEALRRFFSLSRHLDGAGAESHFSIMWELFHVVGDEKFAAFAAAQPTAARKEIWKDLTSEQTTWPITDGKAYVKRHFPKTFAQLNAR